MRDILFRGKNNNNGEWVYGIPITSVNDRCYMIIYATEDAINTNNEVDFAYVEIIPETIGQDICLNDKNGNKIFEGDIVKIGYNFIGNIIVKFENGKTNISRYQMNEAKVIGNIYDNPELLEGK